MARYPFVEMSKSGDGTYKGCCYGRENFFSSFKCCKDCIVSTMCVEFDNMYNHPLITAVVKKPCFKFIMTNTYYSGNGLPRRRY